jgi:hypothetical protein
MARAGILHRASCLHRQDLHAGEVGNKCVSPLGCPHPAGQASFWCPRPDPNGPIQINSDTKMDRPAGDAQRKWAFEFVPTMLRNP